MILVDTSVWIDFLQVRDNEKTRKLNQILDLKIPFGITGQIYQEVLQGITVRSTADCLIVQIARERHLKLFHNDKDFDHIGKVIGGIESF